jgi:hypothetical protein
VVPLLTIGVDYFTAALRAWPREQGLDALVELIEGGRETLPDPSPFLALVQAARSDSALRAVWLHAHDEAEGVYAGAIAGRMGQPAESRPIRILATIFNNTLRIAAEHYAWHRLPDDPSDPLDGLVAAIASALRDAAGGLS